MTIPESGGVRSAGLTSQQARERLAQFGRNELPGIRQRSILSILIRQFSGIVSALLLVAALASAVRGDHPEALAIAAVMLLNAGIGFTVELRSRAAIKSLHSSIVRHARVLRDGRVELLDARDLVPGDVLMLEAGDGVAADARLIDSLELQTSEAVLTGESMPVTKDFAWHGAEDTPLAERRNMVYAGTIVSRGQARAQVLRTGANTEIGRIGRLTGGVEVMESPLERAVDVLGRNLIFATFVVLAALAGVNAARGVSLAQTLDISIALAVAVIPEGLPAVVTITLALGVQRMARQGALMRRMHAIEALGSTTIVCADKTGTLTTGHVTLVNAFVDGADVDLTGPDQPLPGVHATVRAALLATGKHPSADPLDAAIAEFATRFPSPTDRLEHAGDVPFTSARRFSASFRQQDTAITAFVKGAPQVVLALCSGLSDHRRAAIMSANDVYASAGMRVIAVAHGGVRSAQEAALGALAFDGLLCFRDPPAEGVRAAIQQLAAAGIRTVMVTGDQKLTAEAIAREIGNVHEVFSRTDPEQKLRIVEAYQKRGEVVAMFGDGVNDAAALRRADVGVAMGSRGTDVAKQAAAVVLQNDSFATIVAAVREGRGIFDNIGKFVFYLFSCNLAELILLLTAAAAGLPLPLLPLQILWLNLVTDTFPALALAVEPAASDIMTRPPRRPGSGLVSRQQAVRIFGFAVVIALVTLAAFVFTLRVHADAAATTFPFMVLGLAQILHLGTARSDRPVLTAAAMRSNRAAILGVGLSIVCLGIAIYFEPLARILGTRPLSGFELLLAIGIASIPAVAGQLLAVRRGRRDLPTGAAANP